MPLFGTGTTATLDIDYINLFLLRSRKVLHGVALLMVLFVGVEVAAAQSAAASLDPYRFIEWTIGDARAVGHSVLSPRPLYAVAGMGGVLLLLHNQDPELTKGAVELAEGTDARLRRVMNEVGNVKAVRPLALMLFLGSLTSHSRRLQDASFTSLEAIVLSNLMTNTLKTIVGRARPFQDEGATQFQPFGGDKSFPSGHATTVFAFTTPWLLYYRNVPSAILFVLGIGTSFIRMADRAHWFTDVLVGGAIGFTTGFVLTRRHQHASSRFLISPIVSAEQGGVALKVNL